MNWEHFYGRVRLHTPKSFAPSILAGAIGRANLGIPSKATRDGLSGGSFPHSLLSTG